VALFPLDALICFFTMCANMGEPAFTRQDKIVSADVGQEALERLRFLAERSIDGVLAINPIAIWERMSSSDDVAYCPLAFGYSNYARNGFRAKLVSFASIPSSSLGPVGSTLGGTGLAISRKCQHHDIALAYALWIASKNCQQTLYVGAGGQPASRTAWLDDSANQITNGYFNATLAVLESSWLRPRFEGFERLQVQAAEVVAGFLRSDTSSQTSLRKLDELYRKALAASQ
jgi:multiple sugar transport system substrate-binding protein